MKVVEAEETPGMFFAMSNGRKIEKVFYQKYDAEYYIEQQNNKVRVLTQKLKDRKK